MSKISVVIPIYNAEQYIIELYNRLKTSLEKISSDFEIVMVEDRGTDGSWDLIVNLASHDHRVKGIQLSRNFGQHNAVLCGMRSARYEIIITIDDDLQHPPEEIHKLVDKLAEGYDVVYGMPRVKQHGLLRNMVTWMTKFVLRRFMGVNMIQDISPFRAIRSVVKEGFANYQGAYVSIDVLLAWGTTNYTSIPVRHDSRVEGGSNYTIFELISYTYNMIVGFSTFPLQLASLIGICFSLFGLAVLIYVLFIYLIRGVSVAGFPFLASIIAIFSGVQLFTLGVIGKYLAHIFFSVMNKPLYVVQSITGNKS